MRASLRVIFSVVGIWISFSTISVTQACMIEVFGDQQKLVLTNAENVRTYSISTGAAGFGEKQDSYKTPRGRHKISKKIGANLPAGAVFVGKQFTGEFYTSELAMNNPNRDWILTRLLILEGMEEGKNAGGNVDTKARHVMIHGTPDSNPMGEPLSHGCIRMRNQDIQKLFEVVDIGCQVIILEESTGRFT